MPWYLDWHIVRDVILGFAALVTVGLIAIACRGPRDDDTFFDDDDMAVFLNGPVSNVAGHPSTEDESEDVAA